MEPWLIIVLIAGGLISLALAFYLLMAALAGAVVLFVFAGEQGFLGLAAFIACWVFFFPVMLVISIIVGIVVSLTS